MRAYFAFEQTSPNGDVNEFIFELTEQSKIDEARRILGDPLSAKRHVQGKIISGRTPYNPNWTFHLEPHSVSFFEMQIEVCDANVTYVEKHLDEIGGSTLPNFFWCPWSSELKREVEQVTNIK